MSRLKLIFAMQIVLFGAVGNAKQTTRLQAPTQEKHALYIKSENVNDDVAKRQKAHEIREKTIQSIQGLLKKPKISSAQKFELYLRMGEIYSENHDYYRTLEVEEFSKAYDQWEQKKKGPAPKIDHTKSKRELTKSANAFRTLVAKYSKHPRVDAALYSLAKTLGRLDNDNAVLYFKQLIKSYPRSPLIWDAHLALGEYYFDNHKIESAIDSYKNAMKNKNSKAYPYAVYKLGWAYYNKTPKNQRDGERNLARSLAAFKLVVKLADSSKVKSGVNLRNEAINDLVSVWAEQGEVDDAWAYFSKIGEKESFYDLLEKLGGIYAEQGKNAQAIAVYSRLLKESPYRKSNPSTHVTLAGLHESQGDEKAVVDEHKKMVSLYLSGGSWGRYSGAPKELMDDAERKVELSMRRFATLFHKRAQKTKKAVFYDGARDLYVLYLGSFPTNENAYELRYYLADVYFARNQYERAADEYTKVAKQKKGKYLDDAALNAVAAMNEVDSKEKYPQLPKRGTVKTPIALPRVKQKLVEVIDNYIGFLPNEKKGYPMRYTAAEVFYEYGHYDEAVNRYRKLIKEIPDTKQARSSARILLGHYSSQRKWDIVIGDARSFLDNKSLRDKTESKFYTDTLKGAIFSKAGDLEKEGQFLNAGETYLAFQTEFPRDDNADRALYNSSLNFYKVAEVDKAISTGEKFLKVYPKSTFARSVILDLAQTFEGLAQFDRASGYYESFYRNYPSDKRASTALFNAATIEKGLKNHSKAIALYDRYKRTYTRSDLRVNAAYEIAVIMEKMGQTEGAIDSYKEYLALRGTSGDDEDYYVRAKIAELGFKSGSRPTSEVWGLRSKLVRKGAPNAYEARRIIAGLIFEDLNPRFEAFNRLSVTDPKKIEREVVRKQTELVKMAKSYEDIIDIGSPEYTVASLYRLGEMHENFATTLFNAKNPEGASQAEIDQYRSAIEKVAFPLKSEAFKFFEASYKRSREVETFTAWTAKSYDKMAALAPDRYPEVVERFVSPEYLTHRMPNNERVAQLGNE